MVVYDEIVDYLSKYCKIPKKKIDRNSHLIRDLGMSSLDILLMISHFENKYKIEINDDALPDLMVIDSIVKYFDSKDTL